MLLAEANDTAAIQALRQAGRDIGSVLAMCVNLLNPSVIVLGGRLTRAGEHVIAGVQQWQILNLLTEKPATMSEVVKSKFLS